MCSAAAVAVCISLLASIAIGQTVRSDPDETPIKVKTVLLNIPTIVTDSNGQNLPNLTKEDFHVLQNGVERRIEYFTETKDPLNVAILLDSSGSTGGDTLAAIKKAAKAFVDQMMPNDQATILSFDDKVRVLQKLTSDHKRLRWGIESASTIGGIGLMNEAILSAKDNELANLKGKKAIIIFTDGGEWSPLNWRQLLNELIEGDIVIYPVYYHTEQIHLPENNKISYEEFVKWPSVAPLNSMALVTGGKLIVDRQKNFTADLQTIASELKGIYVLGFYPDINGKSGSGNVSVNVNMPGAVARTKGTIRIKSSEIVNPPPK